MDIRVMLADDQAMMRKAMRDVLLQETDVASVALADDGAMAIELSRQDSFDVAVLDIAMPVMNGIMALIDYRTLLSRDPLSAPRVRQEGN